MLLRLSENALTLERRDDNFAYLGENDALYFPGRDVYFARIGDDVIVQGYTRSITVPADTPFSWGGCAMPIGALLPDEGAVYVLWKYQLRPTFLTL